MQTHPLADALFRTDCWVDRSVVSLYIGNLKYRDEIEERHAGRKTRVDELLGSATTDFNFIPITLPAADRYGDVFLPSDTDLDQAESAIRQQRR